MLATHSTIGVAHGAPGAEHHSLSSTLCLSRPYKILLQPKDTEMQLGWENPNLVKMLRARF